MKDEPDWKFKYVVKGAMSAHKQKLFYVYGRGMCEKNTREDLTSKPSGEISPLTQVLHKLDNHVYYDMILEKGIMFATISHSQQLGCFMEINVNTFACIIIVNFK